MRMARYWVLLILIVPCFNYLSLYIIIFCLYGTSPTAIRSTVRSHWLLVCLLHNDLYIVFRIIVINFLDASGGSHYNQARAVHNHERSNHPNTQDQARRGSGEILQGNPRHLRRQALSRATAERVTPCYVILHAREGGVIKKRKRPLAFEIVILDYNFFRFRTKRLLHYHRYIIPHSVCAVCDVFRLDSTERITC